MAFTVYQANTGRIERCVFAPKSPAVEAGFEVLEGHFPDDQFYVLDGIPVTRLKLQEHEHITILEGEPLGLDLPDGTDIYLDSFKLDDHGDVLQLKPREYQLGINPPFPQKGYEAILTVMPLEPEPTEVLDVPQEVTLSVNEEWVAGTLPEGTGVYIDGTLVGETDETELVLSFPLAKTYSVRFDPPFPHKPHEMEVVVNEANT